MGWLLDELFDAEDDLLALVARPGALAGWRRERLGEFCQRVGEAHYWDMQIGTDLTSGALRKVWTTAVAKIAIRSAT